MCSSGTEAIEQVVAGAHGLDEEILALVDLADRTAAALIERVGVFDATEGYAVDGSYSLACWLAARADVGRSEATRLVHFARQLRTMPVTEAAVADGKLSVAKARLLAGVINDRTRARFDHDEVFLVEQVQGLDVEAAKIALGYWKRLADTDGPDPGDANRNWAKITRGWDERWHLEGDFDSVSGTLIHGVLQAILDRMHQDGAFTDRTTSAAQRQAEAFVEMAVRSSGPHPDKPSVRPDIVIIVPHDQLTGDADPLTPGPELIGNGPLAVQDVYRLALVGTVSTMVINSQGRPLHLGRRQRLASADQWLALRVRDHGCVAPGCDRPADWCAAHHLAWWDRDGGATDLDNLCLLCTTHHHLIHDQGWNLGQDPDGAWQLTRPDGTIVERPRYPDRHRPPARARPTD